MKDLSNEQFFILNFDVFIIIIKVSFESIICHTF